MTLDDILAPKRAHFSYQTWMEEVEGQSEG